MRSLRRKRSVFLVSAASGPARGRRGRGATPGRGRRCRSPPPTPRPSAAAAPPASQQRFVSAYGGSRAGWSPGSSSYYPAGEAGSTAADPSPAPAPPAGAAAGATPAARPPLPVLVGKGAGEVAAELAAAVGKRLAGVDYADLGFRALGLGVGLSLKATELAIRGGDLAARAALDATLGKDEGAEEGRRRRPEESGGGDSITTIDVTPASGKNSGNLFKSVGSFLGDLSKKIEAAQIQAIDANDRRPKNTPSKTTDDDDQKT